MTTTTVTFEIDPNLLDSKTDEYLAELWHIAQANPAPFGDLEAGRLVEKVGREIIKRWLNQTGAELWNHQGCHYAQNILMEHGEHGSDGKWRPNVSEHRAAS